MTPQEKTEEPCSCDNCGYQAQISTLFGKKRNWCCFSEQHLKDATPCESYINEVNVGLGQVFFLDLLSMERGLTDSETVIQSLVKEAIKAQEGAAEGYWIKATAGAKEAMFQLGECYRMGKYTTRDPEIAFYYYKIAADQGHAKSQMMVGLDYLYGARGEIDLDKASRYLNRAALSGQIYAAYQAGKIDQNAGRLMSAKSNYKIAAEGGHAWAQAELGWLYLDEWVHGKEKSYEKGMFWTICAYLHGKSSPKASAAAKRQIDHQIQREFCSVSYVQNKINFIKSNYPQYLRNPETPFEGYSWSQD